MIEEVNKIIENKYELKIGGKDLKAFAEAQKNERIMNPIVLYMRKILDRSTHCVQLKDAFDCCGKLYAYNFDVYDATMTTKLFQVMEEVAKHTRYGYVGLVHKSDHLVISKAKEAGYKELIAFHNPRSQNTLSEMCKLIEVNEV